MDFINTLIGVLLLIFGYLLFVFKKESYKKGDKDAAKKYYYREILFEIVILIICGLAIIIRELSKLF